MAIKSANFVLSGMSCQSCATRIEKVLLKRPAISAASVNFASEQAQVVFDDNHIASADIIDCIQAAGFSARLQSDDVFNRANHPLPWRLLALCLCALPFLLSMPSMFIGKHAMPALWQWILASVVQLILALPFYRGAYAALQARAANMDVLIALGSSAIYLYSCAAYILIGKDAHLYFEANVMIITLVSVGKYIEQRSKRESLNSLEQLLQMTPTSVQLQTAAGFVATQLSEINIGDIIRANSGERIAADGVVIEGSACCEQSHLTGESMPITVGAGDPVLAGALLQTGSICYRAEQLGRATQLGDMLQALAQAQGSKAPLSRLADKVAAIFVPVVLAIALITFVLTWWLSASLSSALLSAVAVLVIACPCALGLATPAAIMVGMGQALKHGIWFKDAAALEKSSQADVLVFDKTGTLTVGAPKLKACWLSANARIDQAELIELAAALEAHSNHPLAAAIISQAQKKQQYQISALQDVVGSGLSAQVQGVGKVHVGNARFSHLELDPNLPEFWQRASVVGVSIDGVNQGALALLDSLRADSKPACAQLQAMGIELYIMSGDKQATVASVAGELGIAHFKAEMRPRDKAEAIARLQKQGKRVAMVGDGVNDAPALVTADLSFAIKGAAIAEHSASATLMQASASSVATAIIIARATVQNIKQNLFFASIYNIIGIPLAALGLLNPIIAAAAMALSSISVIVNALRLKWRDFARSN